jgi:hypothetical protein
VFGEIELPLLFIPREHAGIVATLRRYVKLHSSANRGVQANEPKLTGAERTVRERRRRGVRVGREVRRLIGLHSDPDIVDRGSFAALVPCI